MPPEAMLGFDTADDAAVWRIAPNIAGILTIDFLTPIVDEPYDFGRIAAANALLFLLQTAIFGLTSGLSVLVSQYWGRQDLRAISRCLGVVLYAGGSVVGLCVLLLLLFPHGAMALVTNDSLLIQIGVGYLRITAGGYLCSLLSAVYVSLERSTGNPKLGTIILSISVALNTALNYCLIFGKLGFPAWGITGAAAATLIARVSEVCMVLFFICKQRRFPLYPAELFIARSLSAFEG